MHIIYLGGDSLKNKIWIETVKKNFDSFSTGQIQYYDHWQTGDQTADVILEVQKLVNLVKNKNDYFIFAKSVGTVISLKAVYEKLISPQKLIFCGHPYAAAKKFGYPIDQYLNTLTIPVTFVQNEFDPYFGYSELEKVLKENNVKNYSLINNPGNSTHDYENFDQLRQLVQQFIK